jgi:hypothetical protein
MGKLCLYCFSAFGMAAVMAAGLAGRAAVLAFRKRRLRQPGKR